MGLETATTTEDCSTRQHSDGAKIERIVFIKVDGEADERKCLICKPNLHQRIELKLSYKK